MKVRYECVEGYIIEEAGEYELFEEIPGIGAVMSIHPLDEYDEE